MSSYLETLRRVPDDVILAVATRPLALWSSAGCVCGWIVREDLARLRGRDAKSVVVRKDSDRECHRIFGGTTQEWEALWLGASEVRELPDIEEAFVTRVMEAAGVA